MTGVARAPEDDVAHDAARDADGDGVAGGGTGAGADDAPVGAVAVRRRTENVRARMTGLRQAGTRASGTGGVAGALRWLHGAARPAVNLVGTGPGWTAAAGAVTAAWVAVAFAGGGGSPLDTTAAGGAAAAGTAALVGASWRPGPSGRAAPAVVGLALLPLAVAAASGGRTSTLAITLAVFGAIEVRGLVRAEPRRAAAVDRALLAVAAGCVVLVAAAIAARLSAGAWVLPGDGGADRTLALAGAALLAAGAALGPPRVRPLAVPAVVVATAAAGSATGDVVPVVAAAAAVLAAARAGDRPSVAFAALAVGAAAAPAGAASGLLAAAAVLGLAFPASIAAVLGVPGAAALAGAVVPPGAGVAGAALAAGAAGTAVSLVRRHGGRWSTGGVDAVTTPALVLGAWLVLAPGTWRWTGAEGLGPYDRGVAVACAVAALALLCTGVAALAGVPIEERFAPPARPARGRRPSVRRFGPPWPPRPVGPSPGGTAAVDPAAAGARRRLRRRPVAPPPAAEPPARRQPTLGPATATAAPDAPPQAASRPRPAAVPRPPVVVPDQPEPVPSRRRPPAVPARAEAASEAATSPAGETPDADGDEGPVVVVRPPGTRRPPPRRGGPASRR